MDGHLKIICILLIIPVLATGLVDDDVFPKDYGPLINECFGDDDITLWKPDSATSVENFIYMVEKIERNYRGSTEDLILALLQRFSFSRFESDEGSFKRDQTVLYFEMIMEKYLKGDSQPLELTREERCQLFFLLSPAVRIRKNDESGTGNSNTFYGFGLLSLNADPRRSIDMSKVLYGILVGLKRDQLNQDTNNAVDFLYVSTISEVINTAFTNKKPFTAENYENEGRWTSNVCAKEYQYEKDHFLWPVTAEIFGAVDGFKVGSKIKGMSNRENVKLSQILRMYYSHDGFRDDTADQGSVSYCSSDNFVSTDLVKETTRYMEAYKKKAIQKVNPIDIDNIGSYARQFMEVYQQYLRPQKDEEECKSISDKVDICETPSNVFVILDKRSDNITFQTSVTGKLINAMNIGLDEDTITIYANANIENLHTVVNASDSKAAASCALEDFDPYSLQPAEDSKVLTDIKNVMTVYEENQKSLRGIPAKVVVYFNFGNATKDKTVLEKARRELKSRHPHLKIIPIGSNKAYLQEYFTNNQPNRVILWFEEDLVPTLKDKICLAPAVLQHSDCKTKSKYENTEYTDYIGNRRIHHWAMYPQHFLKTFGYKFQFKAQYGKIRVCFSRDGPILDSGSEKFCKETSGLGEPIEFSGRDPCKGRTVHNCDPFYFSIFGREDDEKSTCSREIDDNAVGCKRTDLIAYTVKHEGISCSSGIKIISSPFLLLAFLVIFYVLSQQK